MNPRGSQLPASVPGPLLAMPEMREACARRDFAVVFRLVEKYGTSRSRIARLCDLTPTRVGEIIKGQRQVEKIDVIERISAGLGIPGPMLGLAPQPWEPSQGRSADRGHPSTPAAAQAGSTPDVTGTSDAEIIYVPTMAPDGRTTFVPVPRRSFLLGLTAVVALPGALPGTGATGTGVPGTGVPGTSVPGTPRNTPIDPAAVGYFRRVLAEHYNADNLFGPRYLLETVRAQVSMITSLNQGSRGSLRTGLTRVGARYLEFIGWLHQDAGNHTSARAAYDRAMEYAQAGDDPLMVHFVLMRKANQATSEKDVPRAVALAQAAQRRNGVPPSAVHILSAQQEAHAHAIGGDEHSCFRKLDDARRLLDRVEPSVDDPSLDDPSFSRYCALDLYLEIKRAACHLALGQAGQAVAAYKSVIASLPAAYRRDQGQYLARLAGAHLLDDQPEQACVVARQALGIAELTGSTRTLDDLKLLYPRLEPWRELPAAAELRVRLQEISV